MNDKYAEADLITNYKYHKADVEMVPLLKYFYQSVFPKFKASNFYKTDLLHALHKLRFIDLAFQDVPFIEEEISEYKLSLAAVFYDISLINDSFDQKFKIPNQGKESEKITYEQYYYEKYNPRTPITPSDWLYSLAESDTVEGNEDIKCKYTNYLYDVNNLVDICMNPFEDYFDMMVHDYGLNYPNLDQNSIKHRLIHRLKSKYGRNSTFHPRSKVMSCKFIMERYKLFCRELEHKYYLLTSDNH